MAQRIRPTEINPVIPLHPAFYRPSDEDAGFAEWFQQNYSNSQEEPEQDDNSIPALLQPRTSLVDMIIAQEDFGALRRFPPYLPYQNTYADNVLDLEEARQYVFDFMVIPPFQGGHINEKI